MWKDGIVGGGPEGLPFRGPGSTPGNSENNFSNEPWQILVLLIYMTSLCIIDCICMCRTEGKHEKELDL